MAVALLERPTLGSVVSGSAFNVADVEALKVFLSAQGNFDHLVSGFEQADDVLVWC